MKALTIALIVLMASGCGFFEPWYIWHRPVASGGGQGQEWRIFTAAGPVFYTAQACEERINQLPADIRRWDVQCLPAHVRP